MQNSKMSTLSFSEWVKVPVTFLQIQKIGSLQFSVLKTEIHTGQTTPAPLTTDYNVGLKFLVYSV